MFLNPVTHSSWALQWFLIGASIKCKVSKALYDLPQLSFQPPIPSTLLLFSPPALVASSLSLRPGLCTCCVVWETLDLCLVDFFKTFVFSLKCHLLERPSLASVLLKQLPSTSFLPLFTTAHFIFIALLSTWNVLVCFFTYLLSVFSWKLLWGQRKYLFCSSRYLQHLGLYLEQNKHSVNIY